MCMCMCMCACMCMRACMCVCMCMCMCMCACMCMCMCACMCAYMRMHMHMRGELQAIQQNQTNPLAAGGALSGLSGGEPAIPPDPGPGFSLCFDFVNNGERISRAIADSRASVVCCGGLCT